ncbi:MAG: hypothetical protein LBL58_14490 [Tannerellaceae bacterium]|jgi:hypothetical protein|nr:hypothetical protein [Tannerellaceae bacterium]
MKNHKNIVIGIYVLLLWVSSREAITGQISYANRKLAWISSQLPAACFSERDTYVVCPDVADRKQIIIKYDKPDEINHLGISLFSDNAKTNIHETVCNFLERLFLELVLLPDKKAVQDKLKEYKITIQLNGAPYGSKGFTALLPALNKIDPDTPFTLKKEPGLFTGVWNIDNQNTFTISFPAERELITGYNKREADEKVNASLMNYSHKKEACQADLPPDSGKTFASDAIIYMEKGNFFINEAIHNHIYYQRHNDTKYYLLNDIEYPVETTSNLLLGYTSSINPIIKLTHIYNSHPSEITIPLTDFICLFKKEFESFCSVLSNGDDTIKITLVLHHKEYNYIHMLSAETSIRNILYQENSIEASFHSNISQHNLDDRKYKLIQ